MDILIPDCQEINDYFSDADRAFDISMRYDRYYFEVRNKLKEEIPRIEFLNYLRDILYVEWKKLSEGVFVGKQNPKNIMIFEIEQSERYSSCSIVLGCGNIQMIFKSEDYYSRNNGYAYTKIKGKNFNLYDGDSASYNFVGLTEPNKIIERIVNYCDLYKSHKKQIPLCHALSNYQFEAAEYLLKLGAKLNYDERFSNLLVKTYRMGATDLVFLLMDYNPRVEDVADLLCEAIEGSEVYDLALGYLNSISLSEKESVELVSLFLREEKFNFAEHFAPKDRSKNYMDEVEKYIWSGGRCREYFNSMKLRTL